jgi:hypothetical protein
VLRSTALLYAVYTVLLLGIDQCCCVLRLSTLGTVSRAEWLAYQEKKDAMEAARQATQAAQEAAAIAKIRQDRLAIPLIGDQAVCEPLIETHDVTDNSMDI